MPGSNGEAGVARTLARAVPAPLPFPASLATADDADTAMFLFFAGRVVVLH
jgi:hypothetical protein